MFDVDGHELIDLHGYNSALVHGHAFAPVVAGRRRSALKPAPHSGMPSAAGGAPRRGLARRLAWAERWRFTGSGQRGRDVAVRAARAVTARAWAAALRRLLPRRLGRSGAAGRAEACRATRSEPS